jgi:hypothetical protein
METKLAAVSQKGKLAEALRYALSRWDGLSRFLGDGRIEIDSNVVERTVRPLALNRTIAGRASDVPLLRRKARGRAIDP